MKRIISTLFIICVFQCAFTQSHIRINNYWDNFYYINPSSINDQYLLNASVTHRSQWIGFPGAPRSYYLTANYLFPRLHVELGTKLYTDIIGFTRNCSVSMSYAYNLTLNEDWRLNMGIAPSYTNLYYDMDKASPENTFDPTILGQVASDKFFNTDIGFELYNKSYRFGFSSLHLLSLFSSKNRYQINTNMFYATYRTFDGYFLNYGVGVSGFQYANIFQPEAKVTAYVKTEKSSELMQVGLLYRYKNELGTVLGINLNDHIQVVYSYDFNIGSISRSSYGSHELMVCYKLGICPTCY